MNKINNLKQKMNRRVLRPTMDNYSEGANEINRANPPINNPNISSSTSGGKSNVIII